MGCVLQKSAGNRRCRRKQPIYAEEGCNNERGLYCVETMWRLTLLVRTTRHQLTTRLHPRALVPSSLLHHSVPRAQQHRLKVPARESG